MGHRLPWIHASVLATLCLGVLGKLESSHNASVDLPERWGNICNVTHVNETSDVITVNCDVTRNDVVQWNLWTLRDWSSTRTNLKFAYHVSCREGGNITLPWPMKSWGLVELHVTRCVVTDFYGDFSNSILDVIPDSLQVMKMVDSRIVINIVSFYHMLLNVQNITESFDCGQDRTLRVMVMRNISYGIRDPSAEDVALLGSLLPTPAATSASSQSLGTPGAAGGAEPGQADKETFYQLLRDLMNLRVQCRFESLETVDESVSDTLSQYYHQFLAYDSSYPRLRSLNYSRNAMTSIPRELQDWRLYFEALTYLDLSHNLISRVRFLDQKIRSQLIVMHADLRYNNITAIDAEDIETWSKVAGLELDVRHNPLHCGCEMKDFLQDVVHKPDFFLGRKAQYEYIRHEKCATPPELKGVVLKDLNESDLPCPRSSVLVAPMVVLGVIAFALLVCLVVALKYRREIRILLFTRFHILLPGDAEERADSKRYDAFVSYSSKDEDWVMETLSARLEGGEGGHHFRLCLHHRDFMPGLSITENILNSVEASRHTIVVLTRNFVRSEWALEELRQAYHQSIIEKRRHLIVIILEKVPEEEMDSLLRRCMKTFTYLDVSDRIFWDRLLFSISTRNKKRASAASQARVGCHDDVSNHVGKPRWREHGFPLRETSVQSDCSSKTEISDASLGSVDSGIEEDGRSTATSPV